MPDFYKFLSVQKVAYTSAAARSSKVAATTSKIRVWSSTDCYIAMGLQPTATTSDTPITAKQAEYIDITPGYKVSVVRQASDGNLFITELKKAT